MTMMNQEQIAIAELSNRVEQLETDLALASEVLKAQSEVIDGIQSNIAKLVNAINGDAK